MRRSGGSPRRSRRAVQPGARAALRARRRRIAAGIRDVARAADWSREPARRGARRDRRRRRHRQPARGQGHPSARRVRRPHLGHGEDRDRAPRSSPARSRRASTGCSSPPTRTASPSARSTASTAPSRCSTSRSPARASTPSAAAQCDVEGSTSARVVVLGGDGTCRDVAHRVARGAADRDLDRAPTTCIPARVDGTSAGLRPPDSSRPARVAVADVARRQQAGRDHVDDPATTRAATTSRSSSRALIDDHVRRRARGRRPVDASGWSWPASPTRPAPGCRASPVGSTRSTATSRRRRRGPPRRRRADGCGCRSPPARSPPSRSPRSRRCRRSASRSRSAGAGVLAFDGERDRRVPPRRVEVTVDRAGRGPVRDRRRPDAVGCAATAAVRRAFDSTRPTERTTMAD